MRGSTEAADSGAPGSEREGPKQTNKQTNWGGKKGRLTSQRAVSYWEINAAVTKTDSFKGSTYNFPSNK